MQGGVRVDVYDRMPSVGRKLLMAGKGGLNIAHSSTRPTLSLLAMVRRAGTSRRASVNSIS